MFVTMGKREFEIDQIVQSALVLYRVKTDEKLIHDLPYFATE